MKPETSNYISGYHPVKEQILKSPTSISKILISRNSQIPSDIIPLAKEKHIPFHFVPKEKIRFLTSGNENIAALVSHAPLLNISDLTREANNLSAAGLFVILDEIQDPHNLGAIIRSAVCFGANGIVIQKWRSATLTDTVYKTSAGAVPYIKIFSIPNIKQAITALKELGYLVAGSSSSLGGEAAVTIEDFSYPSRMALVIGKEETGLRKTVAEMCDVIIKIPQAGGAISSLNASVAAGILIYKFFAAEQKKKVG